MSVSARKIAISVAIAVAIIAVWVVLSSGKLDVGAVVEWLEQVGGRWWAPLAFIALYTVFNLVLAPATALTLSAGVIWGWLLGGVWVLAASTVGSAVPYLIGRSGSRRVERILRRRAERLHRMLESEGFLTLLLMRLIPIVPYNVLNYAAGVARIAPRDYFVATFVGTIPGIFIFTYLASALFAGLVSPREAFLRVIVAGLLLGALALVSRLFAGRVRERLGGGETSQKPEARSQR
jgi:uncharacterized membrane protein YdjX (TVP38/TMEM64 family)